MPNPLVAFTDALIDMPRARKRRIARIMLVFNLGSAFVWLMLVIPTLLIWRNSILWVALMSVWANFAASFAALTASLADPDT